MPQTWGVPVEEIERGIRHGVRKVNIDTDCRMAMTGQFRRIATENPAEFDPRKFLKPAMDAMRDLCRDRFERFGTAGNASRIKVDRDGRDGQTLCRRQARPADRNRQSGLSNRQETCHEQDGHAHDRDPQGRQGTLQVRRHPLQENGLLGAPLPTQGHRSDRRVPHHAAAWRRSRGGGGRGRRRKLHGDVDGRVDRPADRLRALPRQGVQVRTGAEYRPWHQDRAAVFRLHRLRPRSVRAGLDRQPDRLDHRQRLRVQGGQGAAAGGHAHSRSPI